MEIKTQKIWNNKFPPAKDIDAFIQGSPKVAQPKLKQLRRIIRKQIPQAEEAITYRMPTFKQGGKAVVAFAGYQHHIGFYPMSGAAHKWV